LYSRHESQVTVACGSYRATRYDNSRNFNRIIILARVTGIWWAQATLHRFFFAAID
jgi:hypothetical protein